MEILLKLVEFCSKKSKEIGNAFRTFVEGENMEIEIPETENLLWDVERNVNL
jgi:hypothetical protein